MAILSALPWIAAAVGLIGGGSYGIYQRGNYLAEVAARTQDRVNAEKAKSDALADAQKASDMIIAQQAKALADTAAKVGSVTERIIHVPVTTACAQSPSIRASSDGVRDIIYGSGGGQAQAGGSASSSMSGPSARKP